MVHDPLATSTNQKQQLPHSQIPEYQELRGFLPFESFLKGGDGTDAYLTDAGYLSDTVTVHMVDALLDRTGTTTNMNQYRTTQDSSSNRYTSQGSFSTNISVASSTTNNSASNPNHNSKEAMLMKLRRFIALRTMFVSTLQRQVRVHDTTDVLVWMDEQIEDEYYYNADTRMQNISDSKNYVHVDDDDDGGDCIVAMIDENECNINAIQCLVTDENTASNIAKPQNIHIEKNRGDDALFMYQQETGGPALLVPGALLFESSDNVVPTTSTTDPTVFHPSGLPPTTPIATTTFNSLFDENVYQMNSESAQVKVLPSLTPPPGFATTAGSNTNPNPFGSINDISASVGGEMSLYGNPMINNNIENHNWFGTAMSNNATPIGESMLLFGGPSALQTANPFVATSDNSRLYIDSIPIESSSRSFLPSLNNINDTDMMFGSTTTKCSGDDTLLFNSALLKSLLMEETTTGGQQPQPPQASMNPFV